VFGLMPSITAAAFVRMPFMRTSYALIGRFAQEPQPSLHFGRSLSPRRIPGFGVVLEPSAELEAGPALNF
jgi:hypothetical protein